MIDTTVLWWWEREREPVGTHASKLAVAVRSAARTGRRYRVAKQPDGWTVRRTIDRWRYGDRP